MEVNLTMLSTISLQQLRNYISGFPNPKEGTLTSLLTAGDKETQGRIVEEHSLFYVTYLFLKLCDFLLITFPLILKGIHSHRRKLWKNQKSLFFNCYIYNPPPFFFNPESITANIPIYFISD